MTARIGDLSAAERNKTPIFNVLQPRLTQARRVLEIGAGTGVHARHAQRCLPDIVWQASETPGNLGRLVDGLGETGDTNRAPPIALDVSGRWPAASFDVIYGANIVHIMREDAVPDLFAGAARRLTAGGRLCLYGPFFMADETPGAGNIAFDQTLRARDPAMGLRQSRWLDALAERHGLVVEARLVMPSDNRLLLWQRTA